MSRVSHLALGISALVLAMSSPAPVAAQTVETLSACYVPATGTVYRIKGAGLPNACHGPTSGPNHA